MNPETMTIEHALRHHAAGRLAEAEEIYRRILLTDPNQIDALHLLGVIAHQQGKNDIAVDLIGKALVLKPDYAEAHNNLGNAYYALGRLEDAIASHREALANKPDYAEAHYNLGNAYKGQGKLDEAVACYGRALAIKPDYPEAHNNLGVALHGLGKIDEAAASYDQALAHKPDYGEALNNLCELYEKSNRAEALRETLEKARQACAGDPRFALREAQLLDRDGDFEAARAVLEAAGGDVPDVVFRSARSHLLGKLCDRLGDTRAAYEHFRQGNRLGGESRAAQAADGASYLARIETLTKRFTADWITGWRSLDHADDGRADPVFLVGFPRSGTTLLDAVLNSHRAITVVDERPTVGAVLGALTRLPGGYPHGLAELDPTHRAGLRQAYFTELDKYIDPRERSATVIDKNPMNLVEAGLIHRIFPRSRFIFSQRHPCDCVLSCFMQNFEIDDVMANFLDLQQAARLYDKTMSLWRHYQTVMPLKVHTLRYESLVESFDETLTPLLDFLGLDWDDGLRDHSETAKRRSLINTASYNQVTEPLYTRSCGRWKHYREQMLPVLPLLLPWAERLGYGD